ncbi:MAG: hypothetical protein C4335_03850 [Armatimonadota bacterium]
MLDLREVIEELSSVFEKPVAEKLGQVMLSVYERLHESLVLQRLDLLERRIDNLADEWRQFARRIEEQLAESRLETDARFRELAEAQRRTEEQVTRLAKEVQELAKSHKDLQKQVGGMSQSFGYVLENEALKKLPQLLLHDYGIQVQGKLKRQFVRDRTGRDIEVNLFGTGTRDGETVAIVGESKAQLSKNDIARFLRRTLSALEGVYPRLFPVLVTHMISEPDAEAYARKVGVALYYSYDL